MKFFSDYFDDNQTLAEWQDKINHYHDYLEKHKDDFSEDFYQLLKSGNFHDAKVKKVIIDGYDTHDKIDEVFVNLTLVIESEDKSYTITYLKVSKFSLESLVEFGYGIEDILVEECLVTENGFQHELLFVGERSWCIACKEIEMKVN